jgi:ubiquinone/menaquinone biosynthesis C-methylase UbiE
MRCSAWCQFLRFSFWLLYNPLAWAYDWVSELVSLGHWRKWQGEALAELCGNRVLELAFGTGNLLLDAHEAGYHPTGIDLSPAMIRITQRKLRNHQTQLPLVRARAQDLPFAQASFDSVLCTFPAAFLTTHDTLDEIARVLCPGGRAVVVPMAKLRPDTPWARLLEAVYKITGQRGPLPDLQAELEALGLRYRACWKPVADSWVLLIILEKEIDEQGALGYTE